MERLQTYAVANGYKIDKIVTEVGSGLNDNRPKLSALLKDPLIGKIVIEHKERLTCFGFNYITDLMSVQGRAIEVVFPNELKDDLVADFMAILTSMCARIYGRRGNKNRTEKLRQCVEKVAQACPEGVEGDENLQEEESRFEC